ncbi:hypothetical protein [Paenibacillus sp. FSL W7-1287]|uniref:hypothetical protein n=1 Tax=Paenibacillus sp. FSL W7-1287 TaxID=2954538 RepID=UPI0030FAF741
MKKHTKFIAAIMIIIFTLITTAEPAEAGFFDRARDIYNVPDKIEELQQEYNKAKQVLDEQLAAQQEQLEQSRQQTEELLSRQHELQESNEYYRQQNEQYREQTNLLIAENENLLLKMEKMEQDRKAWYQRLVLLVSAMFLLILLYALSVRIWRYIAWRKHGRTRSVQLP